MTPKTPTYLPPLVGVATAVVLLLLTVPNTAQVSHALELPVKVSEWKRKVCSTFCCCRSKFDSLIGAPDDSVLDLPMTAAPVADVVDALRQGLSLCFARANVGGGWSCHKPYEARDDNECTRALVNVAAGGTWKLYKKTAHKVKVPSIKICIESNVNVKKVKRVSTFFGLTTPTFMMYEEPTEDADGTTTYSNALIIQAAPTPASVFVSQAIYFVGRVPAPMTRVENSFTLMKMQNKERSKFKMVRVAAWVGGKEPSGDGMSTDALAEARMEFALPLLVRPENSSNPQKKIVNKDVLAPMFRMQQYGPSPIGWAGYELSDHSPSNGFYIFDVRERSDQFGWRCESHEQAVDRKTASLVIVGVECGGNGQRLLKVGDDVWLHLEKKNRDRAQKCRRVT